MGYIRFLAFFSKFRCNVTRNASNLINYMQTSPNLVKVKITSLAISVSSLGCTYLQVWPYLCQVWAVLTYKFGHICVKFGLYLPTSLAISVSSLGCTYLLQPKLDTDMAKVDTDMSKLVGKYSLNLTQIWPNLLVSTVQT
jgi:hypothetical protein